VTAVTAAAAVLPGQFRGRTAEGAAVSFRVLPTKQHVDGWTVARDRLDCDDGDEVRGPGFTTRRGHRIAIDSTDRFRFSGTRSNGAVRVRIVGRFDTARRATGTVRVIATFNRQDELDPAGEITCDSGRVRWTARR
jgi:hypothetical protein